MKWFGGTGSVYFDNKYNHSVNPHMYFRMRTAGTPLTAIDILPTADVSLPTGNLIIGNAGKGIDFSAQTATSVTNAASTAELLDHYEEGTWTPAVASGAISVIASKTTYTRIGRMVVCKAFITIDTVGSSDFEMTGVPFSCLHNTSGGEVMINYANISGGSTYHLATYIHTGNEVKFYRAEDNSSWTALNWSSLSTSSEIYFTVTYFV